MQEVAVRRVLLTVMFAVCFVIGRPAPAHAWWHWLDELTGPGPFMGPDFQWRLVCVNDPLPEVRQVELVRARDLAKSAVEEAEAEVRRRQDDAEKARKPNDERVKEAIEALRVKLA